MDSLTVLLLVLAVANFIAMGVLVVVCLRMRADME